LHRHFHFSSHCDQKRSAIFHNWFRSCRVLEADFLDGLFSLSDPIELVITGIGLGVEQSAKSLEDFPAGPPNSVALDLEPVPVRESLQVFLYSHRFGVPL